MCHNEAAMYSDAEAKTLAWEEFRTLCVENVRQSSVSEASCLTQMEANTKSPK